MTEHIYFTFKNGNIIITQSAGFFSCVSVRLDAIIQYYNRFNSLPHIVDSTQQFKLYKLYGQEHLNIVPDYFLNPDDIQNTFILNEFILYKENFQGKNYKEINYTPILPFVKKYFSPTKEITDTIIYMEQKYNLDYNNICVLFYRGLDKVTEFPIPTYNDVIQKANEIKTENPNIKFVLQSDEIEFIDAAFAAFPDSIVFRDEIRTSNRKNSSVDLIYREKNENYFYSKLFLAIVLIMSKARFVVCNTGNISLWICLFRGNAENVSQYLNYEYI